MSLNLFGHVAYTKCTLHVTYHMVIEEIASNGGLSSTVIPTPRKKDRNINFNWILISLIRF